MGKQEVGGGEEVILRSIYFRPDGEGEYVWGNLEETSSIR